MEESQFISLAAAAKMTNYSQDYISLLCRQGKLKAQKLGRNWVTTKEWVYEYIDKTEGKGASVVPVRVDKTDKEKERKNSGNGEKRSSKAPRPLFGSIILEMAVFCTTSIIVITNAFGFHQGIKDIDRSFDLVKKCISFQNYIFSYRFSGAQDNDETISAADAAADNSICAIGEDALELLSFEAETDPDTVSTVTAKLETNFGEPVTVDVYKEFAVISLKDDPQTKYLYVIKGAQ